MKTSELEDVKANVRIVLSALWTTVMFCYIYGDYFELYVPKKVEGLLNGQNLLDSPTKLFAISVILAIPALMISLSLLLKPKLCRWLNICVGLFFTLFTLLVGISSMSAWTTYYVFLSFLESSITMLIVWRAWTWKKIKRG
jgi:hypothetical protein